MRPPPGSRGRALCTTKSSPRSSAPAKRSQGACRAMPHAQPWCFVKVAGDKNWLPDGRCRRPQGQAPARPWCPCGLLVLGEGCVKAPGLAHSATAQAPREALLQMHACVSDVKGAGRQAAPTMQSSHRLNRSQKHVSCCPSSCTARSGTPLSHRAGKQRCQCFAAAHALLQCPRQQPRKT